MEESNTEGRINSAVNNKNNNVSMSKSLANMASKTSNPYAKAAGKTLKVADGLSNGKASERLDKALNKGLGAKGKFLQNGLNKLGQSDSNNNLLASAKGQGKTKSLISGLFDTFSSPESTKETFKESASDNGGSNFRVELKSIKTAILILIPAFLLISFLCLILSDNIIVKIFGIGAADGVAGSVADKVLEDHFESLIGYEANNVYTLSFSATKLNTPILTVSSSSSSSNYLKRKYGEDYLKELEEFYSSTRFSGNEYDQKLVYDFFNKLYNVYTTYLDEYNVKLDMPLLMSTLQLQSNDVNVIFASNLTSEDRATKRRKMPINDYDYYKDWSSYVPTSTKSTHDIEILAQHMVSHQIEEYCVDAKEEIVTDINILRDTTVSTLTCPNDTKYVTRDLGLVKDDKKYKEFLKEFLEIKYFINNNSEDSGFNNNQQENEMSSFTSNFIDWLVKIANDDSHGYNQKDRARGVDYDCSSLVYFGLLNSGFSTKQMGTSYPFTTKNNQRSILKKLGFEEISFSSLTNGNRMDTTNLLPGDILWVSGHTEVYIGDGKNVGAHSSENKTTTGVAGDQTGNEISVTPFWDDNWTYVYRYNGD